MISLLPLLATAQQTPPMLAVDGWVFAYRSSSGWKPANDRLGANLRNLYFTSIGIDDYGKRTIHVPRLRGEEVSGGTYFDNFAQNRDGVFACLVKTQRPRTPQILANNHATYTSILAKYLAKAGLAKAKPRITLLVKVDLDGDRTDEVLIEARSRDDLDQGITNPTARDYSLVLLRSVRNAKAVETVLALDRGDNSQLNRLRAIADLDGDGRMEVITSGKGYEWSNARLFSYAKGAAKKVLENGEGL